MAFCKDCAARSALLREAAFEGRLAAAMGHAVKGAAEMVGLKEKTGEAELRAEIDAKFEAKRSEMEARIQAADIEERLDAEPSDDEPEAED